MKNPHIPIEKMVHYGPYNGPCAHCGHPKLLRQPHNYGAVVENTLGQKADLVLRDYYCVQCDRYTRVSEFGGGGSVLLIPPCKLVDLRG